MNRFAILIGVVAVIIAGCTSSTTNPDGDNKTYAPSKVGTYVISDITIYERSSLGFDSAAIQFSDSTVYTGNSTVADTKGVSKTAANNVMFQVGVPYDTSFIAEDGAKLFRLFDLNFAIAGMGNLNFGSRWVQIGDQANSTWTGLSETITGLQIDYSGMPLTVDAVFNITGSKVGNENLTINGATVSAMHYRLNYTINFTVTSPLGGIPVDPLVIPIDYWVLENVGIVKTYQSTSVLHLGFPANQDIEIFGFGQIATKYVIAP